MHKLDMPAGLAIRLIATAQPDAGVHRWAVQVHGADVETATSARIAYGSHIGGRDRDQRIDIPAQEADCRLEVSEQHATESGEWRDDRLTVLHDTPSRLDIGFFNPTRPSARDNDVLLSFSFTRPHPPT